MRSSEAPAALPMVSANTAFFSLSLDDWIECIVSRLGDKKTKCFLRNVLINLEKFLCFWKSDRDGKVTRDTERYGRREWYQRNRGEEYVPAV